MPHHSTIRKTQGNPTKKQHSCTELADTVIAKYPTAGSTKTPKPTTTYVS